MDNSENQAHILTIKDILIKYAYTNPDIGWITPLKDSDCELVVSNTNNRPIGLATAAGKSGFLFELDSTGQVICKNKAQNYAIVSPIPAEALSSLPALDRILDFVDAKYTKKLAQKKSLAEKEASDALKPLMPLIARNSSPLALLKIQKSISQMNTNPRISLYILANDQVSLKIGPSIYIVNYKTQEIKIVSPIKMNENEKIPAHIITQIMTTIVNAEKIAKEEAAQQVTEEKQNVVKNLFGLLGEEFRGNLPKSNSPIEEDRRLTRAKIEQLITDKKLDVLQLKEAAHETLGFGLIHAAISAGNLEVAQYFLELGVNPNIASKTQNTALHQAAFNNHYTLVISLIQHGADVKSLNASKESPLDNIAASASTVEGKQFLNQILGLILDREIKSKFGISEFTLGQDGNVTYTHPITQQKTFVTQHEVNQLFNNAIPDKFKTNDYFNTALNESSFHVSKIVKPATLPDNRILSYTEWLEKNYGIVARSERNTLNTTKETGINYIFKDTTYLKNFGDKFCDKSKNSKNLLIYDPVYNNKPAVLLEGKENNKVQNAYQAYLSKMKMKCPRTEETVLSQISAIESALNNIAIVEKVDIAPSTNQRIQFNQTGEHRLDAFHKLANEEKEGYTAYKAASAYKLSLEAFIALNQDSFSESEYKTLKKASLNLMGEGADVSSGLKADANWVEYIKEHPGAKNSRLYNVADAIRRDADDLLNGNPRRRVVDVSVKWEMKTQADVGANQDHMKASLVNNMNAPESAQNKQIRKIPRFFPDSNGKSETDSIILQTGGMSNHSTMVKIWKQGVSLDGQPVKEGETVHHYKFYRTEYNAGAGTREVDWNQGTSVALYTSEIKPCYTKDGTILPQDGYPNPAVDLKKYNEIMESTIKELIVNEREILFYKKTEKGPNGEAAAESVEEGKEWKKRNDKIVLFSRNKVDDLCHKGILQRTGNCTIASQKQLIRGEFIFNKSNSSVVEEQWAFAQTHNKNDVVKSLEEKKKSLQIELINIKTLAVKEILQTYTNSFPSETLISPIKNSHCELVISNTLTRPIGLATDSGKSGFIFEIGATGNLICKDKSKNYQRVDPIPMAAFEALPSLTELQAFVNTKEQEYFAKEKALSIEQKKAVSDFVSTHNTQTLLKESHIPHHFNDKKVLIQFNGAEKNNEKKEVEILGDKIQNLNKPHHTDKTIAIAINDLEKQIDSSVNKSNPKQSNNIVKFGKSAFKECLAKLKENLQSLKQSLGLKSKLSPSAQQLDSSKKPQKKHHGGP